MYLQFGTVEFSSNTMSFLSGKVVWPSLRLKLLAVARRLTFQFSIALIKFGGLTDVQIQKFS